MSTRPTQNKIAKFVIREKLRIDTIVSNKIEVLKFDKFELSIDASATYDNPFDPDDVNLTAYFTSPSGKPLKIPGFFYQDYRRRILKEELRRKVIQVKLFTEPYNWDEPEEVILYLDYLKLINSKTGKTLLLSNAKEVNKWKGEYGLNLKTDDFKGNKVIKMTIPVADKRVQWERLPQVTLSFEAMDWANYDKLEARIYPKAKGMQGQVGIEFLDSIHGWQEIRCYTICLEPQVRLNQWISLEWNFNEAAIQEVLEKEGSPIWKVRFAPTEVGEYRYHVDFKDRTGIVSSKTYSFKVLPSDNPGFIKVSKRNPRYFQFDNGETYFPIGQNFHIYPIGSGMGSMTYFPENLQHLVKSWGGTHYCERFIDKFTENGINLIRFGSSPTMQIELHRLGEYSLEQSYRLDWIIDYAKKHNLYIMYVLDACGDFFYPTWDWHPYNKANGGVINSVEEFLTDKQVKSYYKKRLGYIIARWGYHPNLFALEFWNELNVHEDEFISNSAVNWHKEMVNYLHQIDPYGHLTTSSFYRDSDERGAKMWRVAGLDFTSPHTAGPKDTAGDMKYFTRCMVNSYSRPFMMGEFYNDGMTGYDLLRDPSGIHLHNGIWALAMSGASGGSCHFPWIWNDVLGLFYHFQGLAKFVEGEDFANSEFQPVELKADYISGKEKNTVSDLEIYPLGCFGLASSPFTITVNAGEEIDKRIIGGLLNASNPLTFLTFKVNYLQDSEFGIYIYDVMGLKPDVKESAGSNLKIYLDNELMLSKEFNDPFALFLRRYYDGLYSIKVPAGRHSIKVICEKGNFWVGPYIFKNYKIGGSPDLRILGLQDEEKALLWIQNTHNTWLNYALGKSLKPIEDTKVELIGLKDGKYSIEWWDTYKGKVTEVAQGECKNSLLQILLPVVRTDIGCKIKRGGS